MGLLCHRGVGGSATVARELGAALVLRGSEVHLFARSAPLGMDPPPGVVLHTLEPDHPVLHATPQLDAEWSPRDMEELTDRVLATARDRSLDVLHFHYAMPFAFILERVAEEGGAPALIGTLHGTDVGAFGRRDGIREPLRRALSRLDAVTTVSRSHADLTTEIFGGPPPVVIPNFVDPCRFQPLPGGSSGRRGRPRILHVSNFRPVKQSTLAARLFADIRRLADAELWLLGDGDGMQSALASLADRGLTEDVTCFGLRRDVETIMRQADILLVTSRTESFCLAALEAAACGVPAVAPRVGGLPEIVQHGRTGILFDPGDDGAAAAALVELLRSPHLRARMGGAAALEARRFATDRVVPRYEQLYRGAIQARRRDSGRPPRDIDACVRSPIS